MSPLVAVPAPTTAPIPDVDDLSGLSDSEVADELTTWAGRVAAGEAQLIRYIGEFDERRAWSGVGILSCAHWLSWRLGMGPKSAYERVRVARVLRTLPHTSAEFAAGRLSFTQARAITRVATPEDEDLYVSLARHATGGQLERLVRGLRRGRKLSEESKDRKDGKLVPAAPQLHVRYEDDGGLRLTFRVSAEDGAVVLAAMEAARADLDALAKAAPEPPNSSAEESGEAPKRDEIPRSTRGAGFLQLCRGYLQQRARTHPARARRDRSRLAVQVDPLSGWMRLPDGELLPPASANAAALRLAGGVTISPLRRSDLQRFDAGRSRRDPHLALRELLGIIDGERCRFPTCTRTSKLHAHHVRQWLAEGRTDLANLVLLCSRHHTVVHAEGFQLVLDPDSRGLTVTTSDGVLVPSRHPLPWQPAAALDPTGRITATTAAHTTFDRLDLHYAVSVLMQQAA